MDTGSGYIGTPWPSAMWLRLFFVFVRIIDLVIIGVSRATIALFNMHRFITTLSSPPTWSCCRHRSRRVCAL